MRLSNEALLRRIIRPLLLLGVPITIVLLAAVAGDILLPSGRNPLGRFFKHRDNLEAPEYKAAIEAESKIPPAGPVLVDTDNKIFLYILRYRSYPIPVLQIDDEANATILGTGKSPTTVSYRAGKLVVEQEDR